LDKQWNEILTLLESDNSNENQLGEK